MRRELRQAAAALLVAGTLVVTIDVLLALATNALRVDGSRGTTSLLLERFVSRAIWLTAPLVLWLLAPAFASRLEPLLAEPARRVSRRAVWAGVGVSVVAGSLTLLLAGWLALAVRMLLDGSWRYDWQRFVSEPLYSAALLGSGPVVLAGVALIILSGHLDPGGE